MRAGIYRVQVSAGAGQDLQRVLAAVIQPLAQEHFAAAVLPVALVSSRSAALPAAARVAAVIARSEAGD